MLFIGGLDSRTKNCGQLTGQVCPHCGSVCEVTILKTYDCAHAFFIPVCKYNVRYLVACNRCGQLWELQPDKGREFERTGQTHLTAADLAPADILLSDGVPLRCVQCGASLSPGDRFCSFCGRRAAN